MKKIEVNNEIKYSNTIYYDKINLITQYYIPKESIRLKEILNCIKANIKNKFIDNIYLLHDNEEDFIIRHEKIKYINVNTRLKYQTCIDFINKNNISGYVVIANSDIFFDKTIKIIFKLNLHLEKIFICLSRHEIFFKTIFSNASQDSWFFHTNFIPKNNDYNYTLGYPGCDHCFAYKLYKENFKLVNIPYDLKSYHLHKSKERNYSINTYYDDYCFIFPNKIKQ